MLQKRGSLGYSKKPMTWEVHQSLGFRIFASPDGKKDAYKFLLRRGVYYSAFTA